jgi:hypothetical protein
VTPEALAAAFAVCADALPSKARFPPPTPPSTVLADAAAGRVGKVDLPGGGVAGFAVLHATQALAWLSLTDDHLSDDVAGLTEVAMEGHGSEPKLLYQRLDLPWPVQDRHWILRMANGVGLARACGAWERSWEVDNTRLVEARAMTDAAAYDAAGLMAKNSGSWLLLPVTPGETFGIYQVWVDMGGNIPAEAAEMYARSSLASFVRGMEAHVEDVRLRYGPGCTPQVGGDGRPIPCLMD